MTHPRAAFLVLFFLSGASALVYEVAWERSLRLVFGVSIHSIAVVTAAFMGGLALGYRIGRSPAIAARPPLVVYGIAELGIAAYAIAFPAVLGLVDSVHLATGGLLVVRIVLAFLALLVPAVLMGITLPVAARASAEHAGPGGAVAGLVAANTLGGVIGTLGAGWWWIRLWGVSGATALAIGANVLAALAALALARFARPTSNAPPEPSTSAFPAAGIPARTIAIAAFSVGVQTMALQILWNRMLVCVVENTSSSFSLILASVLLGTAVGSSFYALVRPRLPRLGSTPIATFVVAEVVLALAILASIPLLNDLYRIAGAFADAVGIRSVLELCLVRFGAALVPTLLPAALGAILLPALVDALGEQEEPGRAVSTPFAFEAIGSVVGALLGGFVMIPGLGLGHSLTALAILALATAAVLGGAIPDALRLRRFTFAAVAVAAVATFAGSRPVTLMRWFDGHSGVKGELLFYEEGASGTVAVFDVNGRRELLINCIEEVPNHEEALAFFRVLANAPLLLTENPKRVLVNAVGGGITLGAVLRHPLTEVDAVDLVPELRGALALFAEENGNVLETPGWTFTHDDGRNFLRLADRPYDAITADATHPAAGESWPLYTLEYYREVVRHLAPHGVFGQWLPLHNVPEKDFLSILKTFHAGFGDVLVLFVNRYAVLLGTPERFTIDPRRITERIQSIPAVRDDLAKFGIERGEDLLRYAILDGSQIPVLTASVPLVTDDHASIEFAELNRIGIPSTFGPNLAMLLREMQPTRLVERTGVKASYFWARQTLMAAQMARGSTPESAFRAAQMLEEAYRVNPRDVDIRHARRELQTALATYVKSSFREILSRPDLPEQMDLLQYVRRNHLNDPLLEEITGLAFLRLGRFDAATPHLELAARLDADNFDFLSNLVFAYESTGRFGEALRLLGRLEELAPGVAALAEVRTRLENKAQAAEDAGRS